MEATFTSFASLERFPDESGSEAAENLADLAAIFGAEAEELYQAIKAEAVREVSYRDHAIIRIAADLLEIYRANPRSAAVILDTLAHPLDSYETIGNRHGITKQAIYSTLDRMGNRYSWIMGLASIKAQVNRRGLPKHQQAGADVPAEPGNAP